MSANTTTHPRNLLRLTNCPTCGYDLSALPREHTCPECGTPYGASTFLLMVTSRRRRLYLAEFLAYFAVLGFGGYAVLTGIRVGCFVFILALLIISAAGGSYRRRLQKTQGGDSKLLVTPEGVRFVDSGGHDKTTPWHRVRVVRARPWRRSRRVAVTTKPITWRLFIRPGGMLYSGGDVYDVLGEWTKREAAVIRNGLRRLAADARRR